MKICTFFPMLLFLSVALPVQATAQTNIIVTNTNDSGPGSLRAAVSQAENNGVATIITFHDSLSDRTIFLDDDINVRGDSTTIDGDIDGDGLPDIILDGSDQQIGLSLSSDNVLVQHLRLQRFTSAIRSSSSHTNILIYKNVIVDNGYGIRHGSTTTLSQNSITRNETGIRSLPEFSPKAVLVRNGRAAGLTNPGRFIELFSDSGFQGAVYLGSTFSDEEGAFEFDVSSVDLNGLNVTATATDTSTGGTSGFQVDFDQTETSENRWKLTTRNQGSWGFDLTYGNPGGEFPAGSDNYLLFAGGMAVGAVKDPTSNDPLQRYSVSNFELDGDFAPGIVENSSVPFDALEPGPLFNHPVFAIDPGRTGFFYDHWPFREGAPADAGGNPLVISDKDTWAVFNDADLAHHRPEANNPGLGVEVRQSTYQFDNPSLPGTENIVFLRWRITNVTSSAYDSAFFGIWMDSDVGEANNDLPGTDTLRKMVYMYNAVEEITPTGKQYACGLRLMHSTLARPETELFATDIEGANHLAFIHYDHERYFSMLGRSWDGSFREGPPYGFVEYDGSRYVFPGDPVTGQGLTASSRFPSGNDFRIRLSLGPFVLQPGKTYDFVFALIGGEADDRLAAITELRNQADLVQATFENEILPLLNTDTGPPNLTLGVLQNPEISLGNRLDLYLASDEPLQWAAGTASLNGFNVPLPFETAGTDLAVEHADLEIDKAGLLSLNISARDLAGNQTDLSGSYTVHRIAAGTPTTVVSTDGKTSVAFDDHHAAPFFVFIGQPEVSETPDDLIPLSGAYHILVPTGEDFELTMGYDRPAQQKGDARIAIGRLDNDRWMLLGGEVDPNAVRIKTNRPGIYRVFESAALPSAFALHQNYPNPFNPNTSIRYELPADRKVELTIYNLLGQKVRTLVRGPQPAGEHTVEWNGKNDIGNSVASGVYIYRIETGEFVQARKMVLLR